MEGYLAVYQPHLGLLAQNKRDHRRKKKAQPERTGLSVFWLYARINALAAVPPDSPCLLHEFDLPAIVSRPAVNGLAKCPTGPHAPTLRGS